MDVLATASIARRMGGVLAATGLGVLLAGGAVAAPANVTQGLVLDGVTIVDTHTGKLTQGMAIAIDGGKITSIARAKDLKASGAAQSVDARGKFVVPGYLDMHAHPLGTNDAEGSLTLMLANGVTGFRQMSGSPEMLEQRRQGTLLPTGPIPELLAMPGSILIRVNAGSPEAAVAEVQKQKAEGADFIKVIDIAPDAFFAALTQAKKEKLDFIGHLPPTVDVAEAAKDGMRAIEHLGPMTSVLIGCSTDEAAIRQAIAQRKPIIPAGANQPGVAARATSNPIMAANPAEFPLMQHVIDTYSEAKCRKLAALFVRYDTWQEPTLIRLRTMEFGDDPAYRNNPNLRYKPKATREMWEGLAQEFPDKISPASRATLKQLFALQLRMVKLFDRNGVKMLAGSDAGSSQWDIPGFSIHQEFDLLAEAGLSPLKVLQMTTLDGAKFLRREKTMGSVERGKNADLVLLDANPIASVGNLHKIAAVVHDGSYYSRDALNDMKKRTEERQAEAGK